MEGQGKASCGPSLPSSPRTPLLSPEFSSTAALPRALHGRRYPELSTGGAGCFLCPLFSHSQAETSGGLPHPRWAPSPHQVCPAQALPSHPLFALSSPLLGIEPRTFHMLGKPSATERHPPPAVLAFLAFPFSQLGGTPGWRPTTPAVLGSPFSLHPGFLYLDRSFS